MNSKRSFLLLLAMVVLAGCATVPMGPNVMVLPAQGKPFEVFQDDDNVCRQWAGQQIGESPDAAGNKTLAGGAAIGTLLGGVLGALIGSTHGHAGAGAAIGAGTGLVGGAVVASGPAYGTRWEQQGRYDNAYQQCMFTKGNQVPGQVQRPRRAYLPLPPPPGYRQGPQVPPPPDAYPPPTP